MEMRHYLDSDTEKQKSALQSGFAEEKRREEQKPNLGNCLACLHRSYRGDRPSAAIGGARCSRRGPFLLEINTRRLAEIRFRY